MRVYVTMQSLGCEPRVKLTAAPIRARRFRTLRAAQPQLTPTVRPGYLVSRMQDARCQVWELPAGDHRQPRKERAQ